MSEKDTQLSTKARRFRSLPDKSEEQKAATREPSEAFRKRDNGKVITKLKK